MKMTWQTNVATTETRTPTDLPEGHHIMVTESGGVAVDDAFIWVVNVDTGDVGDDVEEGGFALDAEGSSPSLKAAQERAEEVYAVLVAAAGRIRSELLSGGSSSH